MIHYQKQVGDILIIVAGGLFFVMVFGVYYRMVKILWRFVRGKPINWGR